MNHKTILMFLILFILLLPTVSYGAENNPKVYFIVINKLTLQDIETMDNLKGLTEKGSIGLMNTRGISGYTGAESYATINSSRKTYSNYDSIDFESRGDRIVNTTLNRLANLNKDNKYSPYIGAIGDNLHKVGLKTGIYGNSDLPNMPFKIAALIPMDSKGEVDYGNIHDITKEEENYPFHIKTDYEKLLEEISLSPADLIVVDTGDFDRVYRYGEFLSDTDKESVREKIRSDIDNFMGKLITTMAEENSLLIITSPNSGDMNFKGSRLSPIILWGKGIEEGVLTSATTEKENIVANIDIAPTIMTFLGAPMDYMSGSPMRTIRKDTSLGDLQINNQQINTISKARFNTLYYYGVLSMMGMALAGSILLGKIKFLGSMKDMIKTLFLMILNLPNIFILASIFRTRDILSFTLILLSLIILSISILWLTRKGKNQTLCITGLTIIIIIIDLILKGDISRYSVLSHDPIIGARYYGIGNEMTGLFLGAITIFSLEVLKRCKQNIFLLCLLGISLLLVGHPQYGANVGGTMAFLIAIIFFAIEMTGKSMDLKKILLMGIFIVAFIAIMGYIDIKFNTNTTHLGNSILLITKDGGLKYIREIVLRKLLMNIKLVGNSFWTYLLLLHMALHGLIFHFKKMDNSIMPIVVAGLAGAIGGFLLNDSGLILAAICMNLITAGLYLQFIE